MVDHMQCAPQRPSDTNFSYPGWFSLNPPCRLEPWAAGARKCPKGPFLLVLDFTDFFETVGYLPTDSTPKQSYYSEEGQLQKAYFQ